MKTTFVISGKKHVLKYQRKMSEKEVIKMNSFVTIKGEKLIKTQNFKIKNRVENEKERIYEIFL